MKKILTALVAATALAAPGAAQAFGPTHTCYNRYGGSVTAGYHTSCRFANSILYAWALGRCWRHRGCYGHVYSPVTRRRYEVFCRERGHYPERVYCFAAHTNAFIQFTEPNH